MTRMARRNPPNWPAPPSVDWSPPRGPDPAWGPAPGVWEVHDPNDIRRAKNRRALIVAGVVGAVLLVASACGGGDTTAPTSADFA